VKEDIQRFARFIVVVHYALLEVGLGKRKTGEYFEGGFD
jgi:hypothetical protein